MRDIFRHPTVRWFAIRIALLPVVFVVVSALSYWLVFDASREDPALRIAGQGATPEYLAGLRVDLHLNEPFVERYGRWLANASTGDFGREYRSGRPLSSELRKRIAPTLELISLALLTAAAVSRLVLWLSERPNAPTARGAIHAMDVLTAVPIIVSLPLLIILPFRLWEYAIPVGGYTSPFEHPIENMRLMVPTSVLIGVSASFRPAFIARHARADNVSAVALIAGVVTAALPFVLVGVVLAEPLLGIRGLGLWLFQSAFVADLAVVQLLLTLTFLTCVVVWLFAPRHRPVGSASMTVRARMRVVTVAAVIILILISAAILGPWLMPYDGRAFDSGARLLAPTSSHPLGTNVIGQDIFTRALLGLRLSMWFAVRVLLLGFLPGIAVGIAASRWAPSAIRVVDAACGLVGTLPFLVLVIALSPSGFLHLESTALWVISAFAFFMALSSAAAPDRRVVASLLVASIEVVSLAILAHETLEYVGPSYQGVPALGADIAESRSRSIQYLHLLAGPAAVLCLMLAALNVLVGSARAPSETASREN